MNLYRQILEQIDIEELNLSNTEQRIMTYIYTNINNLENIGVKDIADECYCSTASIHRFVMKFGCNGYKQFKSKILSGQSLEYNGQTRFGQEMIEIAKYVDELDVSQFVNQLSKLVGKRVYVYGSGGSFVSAQYFARLLCEVGIDASAHSPFELAGTRNLAEAVLLISNAGDTSHIIEQVRRYEAMEIPTYAITKSGSILAEKADYAVTHNKAFNRSVHIERESQLMIIMLIEKIVSQFM